MRRATLLILVLCCLWGCRYHTHKLAPYNEDLVLSTRLETRADEVCRENRGDDNVPPYTFKTDGCSAWPDDGWAACCVEHDIDYWCGAGRRREADRRFRECIADHPNGYMAYPMYLGVRIGGQRWTPTPWRWGYGWVWPRAGLTGKKKGPEEAPAEVAEE